MKHFDSKPGERCVRRDGGKARVYALDGAGDYPIHGAIEANGGWHLESWTESGMYLISEEHPYDLIRKYDWREDLAPIWAVLKPEYTGMAMDKSGVWSLFVRPPRPCGGFWSTSAAGVEGRHPLECLKLPVPDCDWKETWTVRPE